MAIQQFSPFLNPGAVSKAESLAMLHLRRDEIVPVKLTQQAKDSDGYKEGPVTNTRFGSFPHSTLIGIPWGTQVRASVVDTGSRGRKQLNQPKNKKRKRGQVEPGFDDNDDVVEQNGSLEEDAGRKTKTTAPSKALVAAATGFLHLLPPTTELWTASLPHRTQVVYTPDYSYILHRLRVRPGSVMIEAGAGSGSFSHAAARAVFNGYPGTDATESNAEKGVGKRSFGKIWSYEFHKQRVEKLQEELQEHGLADIIHVTHRDVYQDGFLQDPLSAAAGPQADAIFLDLPAPWLALRHLTRAPPPASKGSNSLSSEAVSQSLTPKPTSTSPDIAKDTPPTDTSNTDDIQSPLDPNKTVRICTFSPCIEQVQRTITTLRDLGWVDIEMINLGHKRIEIRRERHHGVSAADGQKWIPSSPTTVEESVQRLRDINSRKITKSQRPAAAAAADGNADEPEQQQQKSTNPIPAHSVSKGPTTTNNRRPYREGRLIHRSEPDIRSHTSYLVFAVLPRLWTAEDEFKAAMRWPVETMDEKGKREKKRGGGRKEEEANRGDDVEEEEAVVEVKREDDVDADAGAVMTVTGGEKEIR